jgi:glycosyltransferase involved in cell wall biosynthesis
MTSEALGKWSLGDFQTYMLGFPIYHAITELELAFSDFRIACSESVAHELSTDHGVDISRIHVIENGVDARFYEALSQEHDGHQKNDRTIFFCGRLYKAKGVLYLLEATRILKKTYPRVKLNIFGRGPLRDHIRSYVKASGLSNNVAIPGYVSYTRLYSELAQSDVAVFPSLYEAQSIAMLEAMACSTPVVAFDLPFSREIIRHGETGLLARPRDAASLALCISQLFASENLRRKIGRNAKEYVAQHHSWAKIAKKYVCAYHEACRRE